MGVRPPASPVFLSLTLSHHHHTNTPFHSPTTHYYAHTTTQQLNIVKYYDVVSEVEPKRQELAAANAKLTEANTMLAAVREKVAELNAKVQELEAQFAAAVADKDAAIRESERCQLKLTLANRLIAALASEGERWARTAEQLRAGYDVLTGDTLLARWGKAVCVMGGGCVLVYGG